VNQTAKQNNLPLSVAAFSKDNALRVVFHGDMLLSHILTVTFEWFVLKEIFFAQK
jgi:hypothetical protein